MPSFNAIELARKSEELRAEALNNREGTNRKHLEELSVLDVATLEFRFNLAMDEDNLAEAAAIAIIRAVKDKKLRERTEAKATWVLPFHLKPGDVLADYPECQVTSRAMVGGSLVRVTLQTISNNPETTTADYAGGTKIKVMWRK